MYVLDKEKPSLLDECKNLGFNEGSVHNHEHLFKYTDNLDWPENNLSLYECVICGVAKITWFGPDTELLSSANELYKKFGKKKKKLDSKKAKRKKKKTKLTSVEMIKANPHLDPKLNDPLGIAARYKTASNKGRASAKRAGTLGQGRSKKTIGRKPVKDSSVHRLHKLIGLSEEEMQ